MRQFTFFNSRRLGILTAAAAVTTSGIYYKQHCEVKRPSSWEHDSQQVEESMVGEQVANSHSKRPLIFQWSSLPKFIEKRYDPKWQGENGWLWRAGSTLVVGGVGMVSKIVLKYLEHTRVYNLDKFMAIVDQEHRDRALITGKVQCVYFAIEIDDDDIVSNHESVWDDPVLWGVLPVETLFTIDKMRWVLGAADICFTTL